MMRLPRALLALLMLIACAGLNPFGSSSPSATQHSNVMKLTPVHFREILGWEADGHADALATFIVSCGAFSAMQDAAPVGEGQLLAPASVWKEVCRKAQLVPKGDNVLARQFFERTFIAFRVSDNGVSEGLFTGYYEPTLSGSLTQHRPFMYPLYAAPPAGTAQLSRTQIDLGALEGKAQAVAYVDDPVQRFFLHIQGSGRIHLENGDILHVGYAGTNGMPYTSIGKVLVERGLLKKEEVTMPVLRQWLYDHPNDMWQVMWENQSYIFFREVKNGPVGSERVPLTPGRTLAVDPRFIPLGMPVFIDTLLPETTGSPMSIHRRLMIAQDTGSAIKGPVRGDIFFGSGTAAENTAGRMKEGGEAIVLVPRPIAQLIMKPE